MKKQTVNKPAWRKVVVLLALPIVFVFDGVLYLMTRSSCLGCGSFLDYLRASSLSLSLIVSLIGVSLPLKTAKNPAVVSSTEKNG